MDILSPTGGNVWKITAQNGTKVAEGQEIMILESMKMEIPVEATHAGTLTLLVQEGDAVSEDTPLAKIEP